MAALFIGQNGEDMIIAGHELHRLSVISSLYSFVCGYMMVVCLTTSLMPMILCPCLPAHQRSFCNHLGGYWIMPCLVDSIFYKYLLGLSCLHTQNKELYFCYMYIWLMRQAKRQHFEIPKAACQESQGSEKMLRTKPQPVSQSSTNTLALKARASRDCI